ncbi:MAG TPA: CRTAC1 family protein [Bryobacteraceae bacterium]|nr:CRTAC1 family protein [Bryobacteraceae bacterium]
MSRRRYIIAAVVCVAVCGAAATSTIRFEEVAEKAGLVFIADSSPTPNKNQPETMISGVGLIDYDNDGDLDVYFVNGAAIPSLKKEGEKFKNRLFRNNGDLTFTDVTVAAGVAGEGYGMAVAVGDYDNDGLQDLYVANVTANQLYRNLGGGKFEDVTAHAGVGGAVHNGLKMWTAAAGWFDYNNDGKLDLFLSNYCKWEVNKDPVCLNGGRIRAYCHPNLYEALPNTLYRNNGDGTFTDVSDETGISKRLGKGMGVAFNDYDGDGFLDVFVANDNTPNSLFRNAGGKKFEEVGLETGVAYTEAGKAVSGMGAEFRDLDNDGLPDIWHTATEMETFPLFWNRGKGVFIDVTGRSGLARHTLQMSGWSNGAGDFDNDGWKDLFVSRANVLDNIAEFSTRTYAEPGAVFRNLARMKFENVSASAGPDLQHSAVHRGAALGDIDNDGRIDIVVSVLNGKAKLFHNTSDNANHWVKIKLVGTRSNRMGIGAQLRLTAADGSVQYDIATTSTGYAASSDARVHFGLGAAGGVRELEVRWPSGIRQVLRDLAPGKVHVVEERP